MQTVIRSQRDSEWWENHFTASGGKYNELLNKVDSTEQV